MKTYYHVSTDCKNEIEEFIPRIPNNRASGEDETQKRICVSTSLEGCVKAAPNIWYRFHDYLETRYYDPYTHMENLTTLLEHDEKVGYLLKVYEFHLEDTEVIKSTVLKENGWVPDADKTDEHWLTKKVKPNCSYYILLDNAREENGKALFDYSKYEQNELGNSESYLETFDRKRKKEENVTM